VHAGAIVNFLPVPKCHESQGPEDVFATPSVEPPDHEGPSCLDLEIELPVVLYSMKCQLVTKEVNLVHPWLLKIIR